MDPNDDLWTAIRRVLPGADELAAAVAAELGESVDDVRLSVLIGSHRDEWAARSRDSSHCGDRDGAKRTPAGEGNWAGRSSL